jgi:zinc protease
MRIRSLPILVSACLLVPLTALTGCNSTPSAATPVKPAAEVVSAPKPPGYVDFVEETLPNGLRVIYAPMKNAPVVHVRVLYHVGSRDERPDRQGFAHMFEHMMFRGSQHVGQEQHMKLIESTGGNSNAFTSFDQTTYVNTLPSSYLDMALWLEADRMASFKVSPEIFATERKVVAEEWRLRTANPPTGTLIQDFLRTAYTTHSYRWSPIGDMDQLKQSTVAELQEFFNTYYVPNNACLVIAGDFDVATAMFLVRQYYGWMPRGADVPRNIPAEPEQTEKRKVVVHRRSVPIPTLLMGYKTTDYRSDDNVALDAIGSILGSGRTSRLSQLLVNPPAGGKPVALQASAGNNQLQDVSFFGVQAAVLPGNDPDAVEAQLKQAIADFIANGPTAEELAKYKVQAKQGLIRSRETATQVATVLGEAEVFGGDANLVNREAELIDALTPELLQQVAAKYLIPSRLTVVQYLPDPLGQKTRADQTVDASKADEVANAAVVASPPVAAREVNFPPTYPKAPPKGSPIQADLNEGVVGEVNGIKVVVIQDSRIPIVNFSLVMRGGGDAEPAGKEGLASLTAQMLRRGSGSFDYLALAQELESRGVSVEVGDGGDTTSLSGSAATDQLSYLAGKAALVLSQPTFPEAEFTRLKNQSIQGLRRALVEGGGVASRELQAALWPGTPFGRSTTPESLQSITLQDVKDWYAKTYRRENAFMVFAGDVSPEQAMKVAGEVTAALPAGTPPAAAYNVPTAKAEKRIILIDNPDAKQANVRVAFRGFTLKSDQRFAGNVATQVLSAGLDSRMNKYLRAERGLTYGASGVFSAGRHNGAFTASTDTNPATVGASVEGIFTVLSGMKDALISEEEIALARKRSAGAMVMEMQTAAQQASRRSQTILNGWPADYWETFPQKIAAVTREQVRELMVNYTNPDNAIIVVVGPASVVKDQLAPFGKVEVLPMPLNRKAAPTASSGN